MLGKLINIIDEDNTIKLVPPNVLLKFNLVHRDGFCYIARDIFNAIIQNKLHSGESVIPFVSERTNKDYFTKKLQSVSDYDYFIDENAILKCDLNTEENTLIKNFLNLAIYNINDIVTKIILLAKLNSQYSFLIRDKVFNEFE